MDNGQTVSRRGTKKGVGSGGVGEGETRKLGSENKDGTTCALII